MENQNQDQGSGLFDEQTGQPVEHITDVRYNKKYVLRIAPGRERHISGKVALLDTEARDAIYRFRDNTSPLQ